MTAFGSMETIVSADVEALYALQLSAVFTLQLSTLERARAVWWERVY